MNLHISVNNLSAVVNTSEVFEGGDILTVVGMVIIDILAFWGNLLNIIAILSTHHLRHNVTNLFVLNLCLFDIFASITLLPVAIASFITHSWPINNFLCTLIGFLGCLLTFGSITNICAISIERYYSIKFPMHHAAHMTLTKTLGVIILIWTESLVISMLPLLGVNSYSFQSFKKQCTFSWEFDVVDKAYVITVGIICFVLPGIILLIMYWGVFRVARQAVLQVKPESTIRRVPLQPAVCNGATTGSTRRSSNENISDLRNVPRPTINGNKRHFKAANTLMVILTAYMAIWGPYFIYHMYGAIHGTVSNRKLTEVLVLWLGYSSFAINPFLYGCLNRAIRAELVNIYKNVFCCRVCVIQESHEERDDEDFFQFLEGTSTAVAVVNQHRLSVTHNKSSTLESETGYESSDMCQ